MFPETALGEPSPLISLSHTHQQEAKRLRVADMTLPAAASSPDPTKVRIPLKWRLVHREAAQKIAVGPSYDGA